MVNDEHEHAWAEAMRAANRGCAKAYARLLAELAVALRRVSAQALIRLGVSAANAEDVAQEALLAIHLKRHTWDESRPIVPWLRAIARYKLLDFARSNRRRLEVPIDLVLGSLSVPEPAFDRAVRVERHLTLVTQRQGQVLHALAVEGMSVREAAARLSISEGAVRIALHRGLAAVGS